MRRFCVLLLAIAALGSYAAYSAWARYIPSAATHQTDVLRTHDGNIYLGTLRSFNGTFFEFQTNTTLLRLERRNVAGILLSGSNHGAVVTPPPSGPPMGKDSVRDVDGNVYRTVRIGHQVWMAENLRTTRYTDGQTIPLVSDYASWGKTQTGAYCYYMNNSDNKAKYGALYNWHAVNTKKLCPRGWHVPVIMEWDMLVRDVGSNPGIKLKARGLGNWPDAKPPGTNETGFSALPGGLRTRTGAFERAGNQASWWLANSRDGTRAEFAYIHQGAQASRILAEKSYGVSVRCIRD